MERDHLFISYAWEDGALAEWLTLRLTAEGYRVWCDRFKLLGGECWPKDIDEAIKKRTFRMLQLVSRHSVEKGNPGKERQLALALQRERGEELFIPLNVDGRRQTDLNWQIVDTVWVPFEDWGIGLRQLLKKLKLVKAPKPLTGTGREVAASALLPPEVLVGEPEPVYSNWFRIEAIPPAILRFTAPASKADVIGLGLVDAWPCKRAGGTFYSLLKPPPAAELKASGGVSWADLTEIDGIKTDDLLVELLNKCIRVRCLALGLKEEGRTLYFPRGLVPGERLRFELPSLKRTHVRLWGRRRSGASHFHYHLGFMLRVRRGVGRELVAQLRLRLHVANEHGQSIPPRTAFRRGVTVRRGWWNRQQLNRQLGVLQFLAGGGERVALTDDPSVRFALAREPLSYEITPRIDESVAALAGEDKPGAFAAGESEPIAEMVAEVGKE